MPSYLSAQEKRLLSTTRVCAENNGYVSICCNEASPFKDTLSLKTQCHAAAARILSSDLSAITMASSDASGVSASAYIRDEHQQHNLN